MNITTGSAPGLRPGTIAQSRADRGKGSPRMSIAGATVAVARLPQRRTSRTGRMVRR